MDKFGATVYAFSRSPGPLLELSKECQRLVPITVDLSNWNNTINSFEQLKNISLDGLVNNAGIAIIKPFAELSEQDFDEYEWFCFKY